MAMLLPLDEDDIEGDRLSSMLAYAASTIQDAEYLHEQDVIPYNRFKQICEAAREDLEIELGMLFDERTDDE